MPKIKLIKVYDTNCNYGDYDQIVSYTSELSDWAEISDKDLIDLKSYKGSMALTGPNYKIVIIEEDTHNILNYIKDVKSFIKKMKDDDEKRKKELELQKIKKEEAALAKKKAKEDKEVIRAQKLLEEKGFKVK